jgi:hypothetical protein
MKWVHLTSISANLMFLALFQSLFFVYVVSRLQMQKLRSEANDLVSSGRTCGTFVPDTNKQEWISALDEYARASVPEDDLARAMDRRRRTNRRLMLWMGVAIGAILLFTMFTGWKSVVSGQIKRKHVFVILAAASLGYLSELMFYVFVVKPYKFYTYNDFIREFSAGHETSDPGEIVDAVLDTAWSGGR